MKQCPGLPWTHGMLHHSFAFSLYNHAPVNKSYEHSVIQCFVPGQFSRWVVFQLINIMVEIYATGVHYELK